MSKRLLQWTVVVLSLLPLTFGSLGIVFGIERFVPPGTAVPVNLDNQYRFLSAWYVGLALLAWWIVPRIATQTMLFRFLCIVVFAGGLARLASIASVGAPDQRFVIVMAGELLFPLLLVWQRYVASNRE